MYKISLAKDKPDIGYMEQEADKLVRRGVRLADCKELRDKYVSLRDALEIEMRDKYGVMNPRSPKQVIGRLKQMSNEVALGSRNDIIDACYNSETNKWTSDAKAMQKLVDLGYEFAKDLLDYRHAQKYAESLNALMEAADENGLIHPIVSLTKTNRISYSEPALMNIPKRLLWYIIKPYKPGNKLFSVDIKNQEPNILINMTHSEELKSALLDPDGLYESMFRQCFKPKATANVLVNTLPDNRIYKTSELKEMEEISPALYYPTKPPIKGYKINGLRVMGIETICTGSNNGKQPQLPSTVAVELEDGSIVNCNVSWEQPSAAKGKTSKRTNDYVINGSIEGIEITFNKAERNEYKTSWLAMSYGAGIMLIRDTCRFIDGDTVYKHIMSINSLKQYRSMVDKLVKSGKRTINTIFGTKLYAGDGDSKQLKRSMLDLPVQGSAADILSLLIKRFYDYCSEHGLSSTLLLYYTRHDELIIEVDKDFYEAEGTESVKGILKDMLEHQIDNWTPFQIEITEVGKELDDVSKCFTLIEEGEEG